MDFKLKHDSGTTLIELMVAVALIGIISLGIVGVFSSISKGIQTSKARTLASNLAQEQMQIMKQKAFDKVLITTAAVYIPNFDPDIPYDPGYYPPENILEGSITFQRYTYVQVADENSGTLTYFTGSMPDTGMKAITVTVTWQQGTALNKVQVRNILASPDTTLAKANFSGRVVYASNTAVGIPGALVTVAENVGWQDSADSSGNFLINLNAGSYQIVTMAKGFFTQYQSMSVAPNGTATLTFQMVALGSGTIRGTAWLNKNPVISQVVGSTVNASGFCTEFVEVYNPSTFTWTIASGASAPVIDLKYQKLSNGAPVAITMTYTNLTVGPRSYYLFANTGTVVVAGLTRTADAVFQNSNAGFPDLLQTFNNGSSVCGGAAPEPTGVGLTYTGSNTWLDLVAWTRDGTNPPQYETTPILQFGGGFQDGQQYVRKTSTSGVTATLGRAYDSGTNNNDFLAARPILHSARNTSNTEVPVAGVPAMGAIVSSNDGLSQSVSAATFGSPPVALFQLMSVATGTWTVVIASDSAEMDISSVTVTANTVTWIPNSATSPIWPVASYFSAILTTTATQGFVSGYVRDALGAAIATPASGIVVTAGSGSTNANTSTGLYFLRLSSGTYDITANAGNVSSSYISQSSMAVAVPLGAIVSNVSFNLSQGGRIRGFVTRDGVNPLTGVSIVANDANSVTRDQEITGSNGQFFLINLATGTYTVEPILGTGEASSPTSALATVTAGNTVWVTTFTISGSYGTIRGNVTESSNVIRTGVLIVCTTMTLSVPPSLGFSSLTGPSYYMTNSYEDGTYSLDVRGSTSTAYRVYAYYSTFTGTVSSTTVRSQAGVLVTPGLVTPNINFTW